jgi:hypothetical protein
LSEESLALGYDAPPIRDDAAGRIETATIDGLPPGKRAAVERLDRIATLLDSQFSFLGIRFGIEPIVGLVPVVGDLAMAAWSGYLVLEAARNGAPKRDVAHMVVNVALDAAIGSVPVLGTVFDVAYKANKRNVRILRRHLTGER